MLWARLPKDAEQIEVVMEPTRNAWVALAAWFRRHGATVVIVPPSSPLICVITTTSTPRLIGSTPKCLPGFPFCTPWGCTARTRSAPATSSSGQSRSALGWCIGAPRAWPALMRCWRSSARRGSPRWGSDMTLTALRFLARYANPVQVKRLGKARLTAFFRRSSRQAWADESADAVIEAAATTLRLWGTDGGELDFDALAADIAAEARLALTLTDEINGFDKRIGALYDKADPAGIVRSVPGAGRVCAPDPRTTRRPSMIRQPGRGPLLRRTGPGRPLFRPSRRPPRTDQGRRLLPARGPAHRRRPRPQGRPLPAAHARR